LNIDEDLRVELEAAVTLWLQHPEKTGLLHLMNRLRRQTALGGRLRGTLFERWDHLSRACHELRR
jgi:hypothetical protein